jgi:hypothetical protein
MNPHLTKLKEDMLKAKADYDKYIAENPRLTKDKFETVINLQEAIRVAHARFFSEYLKNK